MRKRWVLDLICVLITLAWITSVLADIFVPGYDPPMTVHAVMIAMASAMFSTSRMKDKRES